MIDNSKFSSKMMQNAGIRPSIQRVIILDYLNEQSGHPTANDIYIALSKKYPTFSKATIYNSLNLFVAKGLLKVITIDGDENRIDLILDTHGHFKCDKCGTIENFSINLDQLTTNDWDHYVIRERNVYFHGLCPNCINQ